MENLARRAKSVDVQTWCRRCGKLALLRVTLNYEMSVRKFDMLDQQKMTHEGGGHFEMGGWGVLWRLDQVLAKVFPREYAKDELTPHWPKQPWDPGEGEGQPIVVLPTANTYVLMGERDSHRRAIETGINQHPRTRAELEAAFKTVWDEREVQREFDLIGEVSPFMFAIRRKDGVRGSFVFQKNPRFYWDFGDHVI